MKNEKLPQPISQGNFFCCIVKSSEAFYFSLKAREQANVKLPWRRKLRRYSSAPS
jgi:hypothetical protein